MKVLLLAGEASGAMYARRIREELLRRHPDAEVRGYADYGFSTDDLAVMGFVKVLLRLVFFLRVKRTMTRASDGWRPDVVCTVDYPGLNLKLAAYAKRRGVWTVHVVCPQVWAWRRGRIPKIEASLDRLCCFFPFEPTLFRPGFATFVGHPLVDEMARETRPPRTDGARTLAVLPGSRLGEIDKHMPTLLAVVAALRREMPALRVVVPAASERAYGRIAARAGASAGVVLVRGGARAALRCADAAVVASGTATLEAAIAGCPTVLVYRVGWLFAAFCRLAITGVRHVGLANIVAEKAGAPCPMPECLQENFTTENVLSFLRPWLTDAAANAAARKALADAVGRIVSDGGAIGRIVSCLEEGTGSLEPRVGFEPTRPCGS